MNYVAASLITFTVACFLMFVPAHADGIKKSPCPELLNFEFNRLGTENKESLCETYSGKLVLVVNTASKCAFTPQYGGLEKLYRDYKNEGFVVLGFPSNDFAGQEPGTEKEILNFCRLTYNVEFPMFEKTHVTGERANAFYKRLEGVSGEKPGWNFHKYLISPQGQFISSFNSSVKPYDTRIIQAIERHLPGSG